MGSLAEARRVDIRNSFTEKCENCTTWEPSTSTTASKLEQVDNRASSGSTGRQQGRIVGISLALKSNARNSASSLTRRGWDATATHWKIRCANSLFASLISCNVRSYVPSKLSGNPSKACRIHEGRERRRKSNWQNTQRNLY